MKKFVTYEERDWEPRESTFYVSRNKRIYTKEKYLSAVLCDLSEIDITFDIKTQKLIQDTIEALSKLDGYLKDKLLSFPMLLLRTEALSSSQIEHYHSSNRNIALAQLIHQKNTQANIISANLNALVQSLLQTSSINLDVIQNIHKYLFIDLDPDQAGKIRNIPNWIGQSQISPHGADYVPPHPSHLMTYLEQLVQFVQRKDLHPLVIAAFSHAYFESIHPFSDGNGRTGRVLMQIILHQSGFMDHLHIPISVGLVKNSKRYIEALNVFRDGNYQEIVEQVCYAILNVEPKVYLALEAIQNIKLTWIKKIKARSDAFVWKIIDELIAQPVIDIAYLVKKFHMNDQATRNNIDLLINAGVLTKTNNARRSVVYETKEILAIMDAFVI